MRRSKFYNMRLPERGAREGEANDAADIEDLTYDLEIIDKEMERQRLEDVRMEKEKATKLELSQHKSDAVLDHPDNSVTDAKLGQRTVLTTSGPLQTLLTAIGNAIKAISGADTWNGTPATTLKDAKTHMGDAVKHITAQERESWNTAATDRHSHTNKSVLDGITAAMVTAWNTVSSKLPLAGGTLTGFLTLHAAPTSAMHAATKKYVDDKMVSAGSGDMLKSVYDPDEDGIVDKASCVPWTGVENRPSALKNPNALTVSFNGASQGAYDGSTAKTVNITPAAIGAIPSAGGDFTGWLNANADNVGIKWTGNNNTVFRIRGAKASDSFVLDRTLSDSNQKTILYVSPTTATFDGNSATATKVNNNLVVKLNSGTSEGTNMFTFNGSAAKSVNVTPAAIGAFAKTDVIPVSKGGTGGTSIKEAQNNLALSTKTIVGTTDAQGWISIWTSVYGETAIVGVSNVFNDSLVLKPSNPKAGGLTYQVVDLNGAAFAQKTVRLSVVYGAATTWG